MQGEGLKKLQSGQPISTREQLLLIAQLSWPAILAQISSVVMQYIDTAMVGQLGSNASAAIGVVATTSWLFGDLCIALTSALTWRWRRHWEPDSRRKPAAS